MDKFTPMPNVFEMVASIFPSNFKAYQCTTVDGMLSLYRGRCPFKVFMKKKTGKYGILIRMLTDSHKKYVIAIEPYVGCRKQSKGLREASPWIAFIHP